MSRYLKICLLLIAAAFCPQLQAKPPVFNDYPAHVYSGSLAKPDVNTDPRSRKYRTTILRAASEPPDFAGHYHVAVWGCGIDCIGFAIADALNGKVYHPMRDAVGGITWCLSDGDVKMKILADNHVDDADSQNGKLYFRQNSTLLVIANCDGNDGRVTFYNWKNNRLVKIQSTVIP